MIAIPPDTLGCATRNADLDIEELRAFVATTDFGGDAPAAARRPHFLVGMLISFLGLIITSQRRVNEGPPFGGLSFCLAAQNRIKLRTALTRTFFEKFVPISPKGRADGHR